MGACRHILKTWAEPFGAVLDGRKRFEIRKFDRDFRVGDTLELREFDPASGAYFGRSIEASVTYVVAPGQWGLPSDVGVLGISVLSSTEPAPTTSPTIRIYGGRDAQVFVGDFVTLPPEAVEQIRQALEQAEDTLRAHGDKRLADLARAALALLPKREGR